MLYFIKHHKYPDKKHCKSFLYFIMYSKSIVSTEPINKYLLINHVTAKMNLLKYYIAKIKYIKIMKNFLRRIRSCKMLYWPN